MRLIRQSYGSLEDLEAVWTRGVSATPAMDRSGELSVQGEARPLGRPAALETVVGDLGASQAIASPVA